jgi:AraC-like DNA-binding protein
LLLEILKHPELIFSPDKFKTSYLENSPFSNNSKFENNIPKSIYNDINKKIDLLIKDRSFLINPSTDFDVFCNRLKQSKFHIRSYLKINNSSFTNLKNEARVNEAIKYIESEKKYKLDYIAAVSGFNTRSNFYKIFKNVTGCTPSQYEKRKI